MSVEFVAFDRDGKEVETIDHFITHREFQPGLHWVQNDSGTYAVAIPFGGRFEIRQKSEESR